MDHQNSNRRRDEELTILNRPATPAVPAYPLDKIAGRVRARGIPRGNSGLVLPIEFTSDKLRRHGLGELPEGMKRLPQAEQHLTLISRQAWQKMIEETARGLDLVPEILDQRARALLAEPIHWADLKMTRLKLGTPIIARRFEASGALKKSSLVAPVGNQQAAHDYVGTILDRLNALLGLTKTERFVNPDDHRFFHVTLANSGSENHEAGDSRASIGDIRQDDFSRPKGL